LENYNLMLKREKAIPSYIAAMDKVWECHRMVGNYWAEQTGTRYRYEDGLMLGLRLAPIPQVFDRFQDVQSTIQELSNGLTSIVEATQRREGVTREEAIRRVEERRKDEMVGRQDALKESGATEQIVEVETTNVLNGAQVVAAKGIVEAVSVGTLPRDAGLGMLRILFNLSDAQAGLIMGSAGGSFVPAAPDEPGTAAPAPAPGDGDGAPPTKAAAGEEYLDRPARGTASDAQVGSGHQHFDPEGAEGCQDAQQPPGHGEDRERGGQDAVRQNHDEGRGRLRRKASPAQGYWLVFYGSI